MTKTKSKKSCYSIQPLDTLFFRDGKPFSKGDEGWGNGTFPPSPATFYGALRTLYFSHHIQELPLANAEGDPTKDLEIEQLHIFRHKKDKQLPLFPIPLDLVGKKEKSKGPLYLLNLSRRGKKNLSYPLSYLLEAPSLAPYEKKEGYLEKKKWREYLQGEREIEKYRKMDKVFVGESKIGLGRSNCSRTAKEGELYRVGMTQLIKGVGFYLKIKGLDIPSKGILRLGGEGKGASISSTKKIKIPFPKITGDLFKIVLTTPAIFDGGWLPSWIDDKTFQGGKEDVKITLVSACVGRPVPIGGFDIKARCPKTMYRAVPAGSVYYFRLEEGGSFQDVEQLFHGKTISDHRGKEGFGIGYVGNVQNL